MAKDKGEKTPSADEIIEALALEMGVDEEQAEASAKKADSSDESEQAETAGSEESGEKEAVASEPEPTPAPKKSAPKKKATAKKGRHTQTAQSAQEEGGRWRECC